MGRTILDNNNNNDDNCRSDIMKGKANRTKNKEYKYYQYEQNNCNSICSD